MQLDTFSKRVLVIAVSFSLVLLSASLFVFTLQRATAGPQQQSAPPMYRPEIIGLGVVGDKGYYAAWDKDQKRYMTNYFTVYP
ncbi:hypothetical protein GCM10027592_29220 [Spirosoma flavus]